MSLPDAMIVIAELQAEIAELEEQLIKKTTEKSIMNRYDLDTAHILKQINDKRIKLIFMQVLQQQEMLMVAKEEAIEGRNDASSSLERIMKGYRNIIPPEIKQELERDVEIRRLQLGIIREQLNTTDKIYDAKEKLTESINLPFRRDTGEER